MSDLPNNSFTFTEIPNNVKVGAYSSIANGVIFHGPNDNHLCVTNRKCVFTTNWEQEADHNETVIGSDVWIAQGVRVLNGVHIGDGAIIGAGTVLSKDVPPFAVVVGNPQVVKRFRFTQEQIIKLLEIKWWNLPEEDFKILRPFMKDIDIFLLKYDEYKRHGSI